MIGTIFNIAILRLWNNKQELLLALVVPIIFFTIFAIIFSRGIATGTRPIDLAVIDADQSKVAKQITHFLDGQEVLRIGENVFAPHPSLPTRVLAEKIIQDRNKEVVLYLPPRLQHDLQRGNPVTLQILNEGSNPVGAQIVGALLTQAVATATRQAQPPPPHPAMPRQSQRGQAVDHVQLVSQTQQGSLAGDSFTIVREDVLAGDKSNPKIAMYAAGIAVMFLLFSVGGAVFGMIGRGQWLSAARAVRDAGLESDGLTGLLAGQHRVVDQRLPQPCRQ